MALESKTGKSSGPMQAGETTLSRNPARAMMEMMDTINALRALYKEENAVLEAADTRTFLAMQERKMAIVRAYRSFAQQMIERRAEFKSVDPKLRREMAAAYEDFTNLAAANMESLDRVRLSVKRLGNRIMHVARESARKRTPNYGASGNLNINNRKVSIGLNQSA